MNHEHQSHGFRILGYDSVSSTNDEADSLAQNGAPDRTLVWARSQSSGRGRLGRAWVSPEGNLYTTALLDPGAPLGRLQELSFVASLAVYDTVAGLLPDAELVLKWPNDVLLGGAKISGILTETRVRGDHVVALLGVGINLTHAPGGARYPTTALADHLAAPLTVEGLLEHYLKALSARYALWCTDGFEPIRKAWVARSRWIGRKVSVENGGQKIIGHYDGIEADGSMSISGDDGEKHRISAGDVRLAEGG
ncbi:biotin--[acetyl-CoA-carboxylase] ligase [Nisaea nitritireducens]|uniref:biotin--[acetyl-CoA-carboxylase] ligase n=1 Tax=Nisaea nitritireducens TaxID=568392 RepID=UPI001866CE28|nr:biotin--[acetyl-CoA-carboxylase] ligase [Nisaea nitritireducens]